jgi:hypothetical protein
MQFLIGRKIVLPKLAFPKVQRQRMRARNRMTPAERKAADKKGNDARAARGRKDLTEGGLL